MSRLPLCLNRVRISQNQHAPRLGDSAHSLLILPIGALSATEEATEGPDDPKVTPAIAQYLKLKDAHPGFLLLFQMGEFYEAFFEDAVKAAELLGIALTRRYVSM